MCNIAAASSDTTNLTKILADLIPASVAELSLLSNGTTHHEEALDVVFHYLRSEYDSRPSKLSETHISCPHDADEVYKERCDKIVKEGEEKGLAVFPSESTEGFLWDGEP
jgi:hypothetical protein